MSSLPPPPGLAYFRSHLQADSLEKSTELLVSLFRRRQIRGPKSSALATAWLLRKVVLTTRASDPTKLILRVRDVGRKLISAAPFELSVGNIVRRVLGAIREEEENRGETPNGSDFGSVPPTPIGELPQPAMIPSRTERPEATSRPTLISQPTAAHRPPVTSMFSILAHPTMRGIPGNASPVRSGSSTPSGTPSIPAHSQVSQTDLRIEVVEAITEIVDELDSADEQVASYAREHISPGETIFTLSTSSSLQKFLLKAAEKRKFTVIQAESYPSNHKRVHRHVTGKAVSEEDEDLDAESFSKPLTSAGVTVLLIPDHAIFALMPRATKVILSATAVLSNGSFIADAGTKPLVLAAKHHRVPVIVLAETYKLSPLYPYDPFDFVDYGDVQDVVPYQDRELSLGLQDVKNPVTEYVEAEHIDLFVTNLGAVSGGYMYRTIKEQYHSEDIEV